MHLQLGLCVHIRQVPPAYVTYITYMVYYVYVCVCILDHNVYTALCTQVWQFVRIVQSNKMKLLSIRIDELSGISPEMKIYINQAFSDRSIGIRKDRRVFLADVSSAPINKVFY